VHRVDRSSASGIYGDRPPPAVLRHKPFALFWTARLATTIAFQVQAVAVGWQIYTMTESAFYLGLVGLAQFLPMFFLTLVVGYVTDRFDRRTVSSLCQATEGLAVLTLAAGSWGGWSNEQVILIVSFVLGSARAFEGPSMQALMPGLVPREVFPPAVAWTASATQTATIVGPALGGLLYAAGAATVYAAAGIMFLLAALLVVLIRRRSAPARQEPTTMQSLFAGIAFIRKHPVILGAISLDLFAVLLGGATALLPIYARDILATGPWGLGLLRSAPAIGALATSLFLARQPLRQRVGRTMFAAVAVFGLATVGFALSVSFPLSLAMLVVLGAADVVSVMIRMSLVQLGTPDEMRGRVSAVNSLFIGTSNQLGEFESGLTAAWFGTVPAALIGGIGTLVVAMVWLRLFPDLARKDGFED
jgi:MFS family permease